MKAYCMSLVCKMVKVFFIVNQHFKNVHIRQCARSDLVIGQVIRIMLNLMACSFHQFDTRQRPALVEICLDTPSKFIIHWVCSALHLDYYNLIQFTACKLATKFLSCRAYLPLVPDEVSFSST